MIHVLAKVVQMVIQASTDAEETDRSMAAWIFAGPVTDSKAHTAPVPLRRIARQLPDFTSKVTVAKKRQREGGHNVMPIREADARKQICINQHVKLLQHAQTHAQRECYIFAECGIRFPARELWQLCCQANVAS